MNIRQLECRKLRELAVRQVEDSIVDDSFYSADKGPESLDGWGSETVEKPLASPTKSGSVDERTVDRLGEASCLVHRLVGRN